MMRRSKMPAQAEPSSFARRIKQEQPAIQDAAAWNYL